jgi:RND superfamily putative drug exporter
MQGGLSSADFSQAAQLSAGTAQVKDGYAQVASALDKLAAGVDEGAAGAAGLQAGIAELRSGLAQVASQTEQLATGLEQLRQGYGQTLDGYAELTSGLPGVQAGLESMNGLIDKLGQSHRELSQDADYATLRTTGQQLETALASMTSGLGAIKQNVAKLHTSFDGANDGLKQLHAAQTQMVNGMKELEQGAGQLAAGLKQGSAGNKELAASMAKLNTALADIQGGQEQLNAGLGGLSSGLSEMKTGLQKSSQGLGDIADGLHKTSAFITQIGATKTFFIPKEAMSAPAFAQAKDVYLSKDRTMTKLLIILDEDPYSPAALDVIEQMNATLDTGIEGTVLKGAVYGAAGPSSTTYDMNNAQLASFNSTAVIVIISVFLVLLLVIRSFWPSIFMIASLIAAYYVGMGAAKLVTAYVIGADGVSSFVPFFSFIVIVAVGVDYGIFLMMRYKEYGHFDPREAIVRSARSVGGVILSAMVILGGTFATLIPSGLVLLIELASAVIAGLVVLTFVLLPMLVPALMALPGMMRDRKLKRNGGGPEGNNG